MSVKYENVNSKFQSENIEKINQWIHYTINDYNKKEGEITVIYTDDNYLLNLNKTYLQRDNLTDIITFNYNRDNIISGDLFISIDAIKRNSKIYKVSFNNELLRVIIHGILHLLGVDDKTEDQKKLMKKEEDRLLNLYYNSENEL